MLEIRSLSKSFGGVKATDNVTLDFADGSLTAVIGGTVVNDSVATDLGTQLVKVDVAVSWTMTLGGRARTEQTSSIVSNGTKK